MEEKILCDILELLLSEASSMLAERAYWRPKNVAKSVA